MLANVVGLSLLVMFDDEAEDRILGVGYFYPEEARHRELFVRSIFSVVVLKSCRRKDWMKRKTSRYDGSGPWLDC
jgi:hypothetical protein